MAITSTTDSDSTATELEEAASELDHRTPEREELRGSKSWLVRVDLGEEELEIIVLKKSIKDEETLKRAIAKACTASEGSCSSHQIPQKWSHPQGRSIAMQVQYLDNEDEFRTLSSRAPPFRVVRKSERLLAMPT